MLFLWIAASGQIPKTRFRTHEQNFLFSQSPIVPHFHQVFETQQYWLALSINYFRKSTDFAGIFVFLFHQLIRYRDEILSSCLFI